MADDLVVRKWGSEIYMMEFQFLRNEHNALVRAHDDLFNRLDNASSLLEAAQAGIKRLEAKLAANEEEMGIARITLDAKDKVIEHLQAKLAAEPLGEPFQKVLDDNRWELYARSEPRKDGTDGGM